MQAKETTSASQLPRCNQRSCSVSEFNHGNVAVNHPSGQDPDGHLHILRYPHDVAHYTHFPYQLPNRRNTDGNGTNPVSRPDLTSQAASIAEYLRSGEGPHRTGGLPSNFEVTMGYSVPYNSIQTHATVERPTRPGNPLPEQCHFQYPNPEFYGALPYYQGLPPMPERRDRFEVHRSSHLQHVAPASDHLSAQPALISTPAVVHRPQPSDNGFPATAVQSSGSSVSPAANTHETNIMHHYSDGTSQGAPLPPIRSPNNGFNEAVISPVNADPITREDGSVVCSECSEKYGNMQSWRRHAARVHPFEGVRMIPCRECRVQFRNDGNLRRHMRTAHAQIPGHIRCQCCEATFTSERALSLHTKKIHTIVSGTAQGRVTRRRRASGQLGNPVVTNRPSRRRNPASAVHKCTACDYVSKWKGNISRHYDSVHLKLRSHSCDLCDRRFNTSSNLAVHKMTHQRQNVQQNRYNS